jgi:hypothetical protein
MNIEQIKQDVVIEDGHILLGKPLKIEKYGKTIEIKPLNWFYQWDNYIYNLGVFLQQYFLFCENARVPGNLEDISKWYEDLRYILSNKKAFKALVKICELNGVKKRWMKKKFTWSDYIEIFVYTYLFNIMGLKKNLFQGLKLIFPQMGSEKKK